MFGWGQIFLLCCRSAVDQIPGSRDSNSPIDQVSYQASTANATDHWKWEGGGRQAKGDASNKDDSLEAFAENGDEW